MNKPEPPASRRYIVMGVSGCGKSVIGKELARRLAVPYVEGDEHHPAANIAKMAAGIALDDHDRSVWLQRLQALLANAREHESSLVLSCSALKLRYRDLLRLGDAALVFLHLDGSPALIQQRVAARKHHFMPASLLQSQFRDLQPLQDTELGSRFDISQPVSAIVDNILAWIGQTH